ncbi:MAG: 50S ribosomal protein L23 [Spirochaetales bacterium]|nr:50S ribosomal protein L23 [Spirochaetales bacterium]MCF7937787.1 50S ribosomal protein L23 [Spirochaetales bacterium]
MNADQVIIEPVVTEKSNMLREQNKYTFKVYKAANKVQIMQALKELYDVNPVACRTINVKPKPKRQRLRTQGRTASWKKAVVTLSPGDSIDAFEGA